MEITPSSKYIYKKDEDDNKQFMHSKCYIITDEKEEQGCAIVGSSNFTKNGLEGNAELNYLDTQPYIIFANGSSKRKGHIEWFEEKWQQSDDWTKEFLEQVLLTSKPVQKMEEEKKAIKEMDTQEPLTPYELYIKLLHYNFGDMIDVDTTKVISSYLPKEFSPLEYQLDAVKQCFSTMKAHGGFMLADVVGLGKTIVGTLVIKYFLNYPDDGRERNVLIITPPAIKSAWEETIKEFDRESDNVISPYIDFITTGSIGNLVDDPDADEDEENGDFEDELTYKNYVSNEMRLRQCAPSTRRRSPTFYRTAEKFPSIWSFRRCTRRGKTSLIPTVRRRKGAWRNCIKNKNEAPMYALNAILRGRTQARKGTVFGRKNFFSKTRKKSKKSRKNT